jgi:hypothetical protein
MFANSPYGSKPGLHEFGVPSATLITSLAAAAVRECRALHCIITPTQAAIAVAGPFSGIWYGGKAR